MADKNLGELTAGNLEEVGKNGAMNRQKSLSVTAIVTLVLVLIGISLPAAGVPRAGSICKKAQQVRVVGNVSLKCVKSGKKLVWRVANSRPVIAPTVEVTPSPIPTPAPTSSPIPATATPSDKLEVLTPMAFELRNNLLFRRAESGLFFEKDSRPSSKFSLIRQRAYAELNQSPGLIQHPNVELIFDVTSSFPKPAAEFMKLELARAATLWNDYFDDPIKVYVSLVTEKDREYIKSNPYMRNNLPSDFDRFDTRTEPAYVSGGGAFWHFGKEWSGHIYLGTASWTEPNVMRDEQAQVARHEFVHIAQGYAVFKNFKTLGLIEDGKPELIDRLQPSHFREGGANTISFLTSFQNIGWSSDALDWLFWKRSWDAKSAIILKSEEDVIRALRETECVLRCRPFSSPNPEKAFAYSYALGALAYEWVIGTYGFDGFKTMLNQMMTSQNFDEVVRKSFNLSKDELYRRVAPYIFEIVMRLGLNKI